MHGSMTSFMDSVNTMGRATEKLGVKISDIFTESPGIEDVFIKINSGIINTNN